MTTLRRVEPVRAWDEGDATTVLARDGRALRFDGDSADLAREALAFFAAPAGREALVAHLARRAGVSHDEVPREPVEALVALLLRHGVLTESPAPQRVPSQGRRVLVAVTGAVAAVDAPALVRLLQARGHAVRVALSSSARRFVSAAALEALTHARVHRSLWDGTPDAPSPHVALASWAELIAVYPCSATTLSRIATGDCADLVSAVVTASRAPKLLAPSMNAAMLQSPAVQRNLATLRGDGVLLAHPGVGDEVALAPRAREDMLGPAIPPHAFADLIERALAAAPQAAWDAAFRDGAAPPWSVASDEDLASLLRAHAPPSTHPRLLDAGTGDGAVARTLAAQGYTVTALDVSPAAIARARRDDGDVTWLVDDVSASRLYGRFDALHDRGCLHALDEGARARYVARAAAWLRAGGVWVVKVHDASCADCGTTRFTPEALDAAMGDGFVRIALSRCDFGGPGAPRPGLAAAYRRA